MPDPAQEPGVIREPQEREGEELFHEDVFAADVLAELERRNELERIGREAAHLIIDLQDRGPLYKYVQQRRKEAAAALLELATANPRDVVAITQAQSLVREYLKAIRWVHVRLEEAEDAARIINGEDPSADPDIEPDIR